MTDVDVKRLAGLPTLPFTAEIETGYVYLRSTVGGSSRLAYTSLLPHE